MRSAESSSSSDLARVLLAQGDLQAVTALLEGNELLRRRLGQMTEVLQETMQQLDGHSFLPPAVLSARLDRLLSELRRTM